jgi:hypothetical protein
MGIFTPQNPKTKHVFCFEKILRFFFVINCLQELPSGKGIFLLLMNFGGGKSSPQKLAPYSQGSDQTGIHHN